MYLTLRLDLDYVPWDTPDAEDFGHGEPAMILRLLEFAQDRDLRMHFFASNRVLRAFPAVPDAILNGGHALDWLCKHPESFAERHAEASELFRELGHTALGLAVRGAWPSDQMELDLAPHFRFLCAEPGPHPAGVTLYAVESKSDRESMRMGQSIRNWAESTKMQIRQLASRNEGMVLSLRPQVLAKFDPRLATLKEVVDLSTAVGLPIRTLRELVNARPATGGATGA